MTSTSEHTIDFPVYYEDTDFSGFVYHANYLKFFERAREHAIGINVLKNLFFEGTHFVVTHIDISFRAPAKHGDIVTIHSTSKASGSPRVTFYQRAQRGNKILVEATITLACLDRDHRPQRLPANVLSLFNKLDV